MIYDGAFSDATHFGQPKALGDGEVTAEEALAIARDFVGVGRVASARPAGETAGLLAGYSITLTLQDGSVLNAEVTRQGGKMLWLMPEHASFPRQLTPDDCVSRGLAFLESRGYGPLESNHVRVYDGLCVVNYVAVQDGVLLYPDLIKLQLRMDTGEVVGLESNNYLMNHTLREGLQPVYSKLQVLRRVSPLLGAADARLCLIPHLGEERLCYEIPGMYEENEYRVYVDARTGEEVEILMLVKDAEGALSV
jgi:germination protein YpeB